MPNCGNCAGEEFAAFSGMGIISSYLVLFISFYLATYKTGKSLGRTVEKASLTYEKPGSHSKAVGKANGHANGSANGAATGAESVASPNIRTRSRKA